MTDPNGDAGAGPDDAAESDSIGLLRWYSGGAGLPAGPDGARAPFAGTSRAPFGAPSPFAGPAPPSPTTSPLWPPPQPVRARRPRRSLLALVGAAAVAVVVVALLVVGGGGGNAGAVVVNAVNSTLGDKTAAITMEMHGSAGGQDVDLSGSGAVDFTSNAMKLGMTVPADGQQIQVQVIYVGNTVYVAVPGLGQLAPGKSWLSVDLSSVSPSAAAGSTGGLGAGGNPAAMLRLLAERGNTVKPLGASTLDGVSVQGYSVSVGQSALQSELASGDVPSWMRQAMSNVNLGALDFDVFVDGQGRLRRESMSMQMSAGSVPVSFTMALDFSDYGSPVDVSAPPAGQVLDMQQFLQQAPQGITG
jgi:hypothetical protein